MMKRNQTDARMKIALEDGTVMSLAEWFAIHLPREDQEDERSAVRFAMDAQFEHATGVISRVIEPTNAELFNELLRRGCAVACIDPNELQESQRDQFVEIVAGRLSEVMENTGWCELYGRGFHKKDDEE